MTKVKGLHLWVVDFGVSYPNLYITTQLRAPLVAVRRALNVAKDEGYRGTFRSIEYKGTLDA